MQQCFEVAKLLDQQGSCFNADSGDAWHIVCGVSCKRLYVDHFTWLNTEFFFHFFNADAALVAWHRVEHAYTLADKLHKVFVAGNNCNMRPYFAGLAGICCNQIVSLISFLLDRRKSKRPYSFPNERKLRDEFVWSCVAVCLILRVNFVAECLSLMIEDNTDMRWAARFIFAIEPFAYNFKQH